MGHARSGSIGAGLSAAAAAATGNGSSNHFLELEQPALGADATFDSSVDLEPRLKFLSAAVSGSAREALMQEGASRFEALLVRGMKAEALQVRGS